MVLADWDFINANYILDTSRYVSAPSSIWFRHSGALLKASGALQIPQGFVDTWCYITTQFSTYYQNLVVYFRCTDSPNSFQVQEYVSAPWKLYLAVNGYTVCMAATASKDIRVWKGTTLLFSGTGQDYPRTTWKKFRIRWYIEGGKLYITTYYWTGTEWFINSPVIVDGSPNSGNYYRCGVGGYGTASNYCDLDDVEVWESF